MEQRDRIIISICLILFLLIGVGIGLYYGIRWGRTIFVNDCINITQGIDNYCTSRRAITPLYNFTEAMQL